MLHDILVSRIWYVKKEQFILLILQIKDNLFNETFLDKGSTAFIINLQTKCFFLLQCEICQGEIKGTDLSAHPVDCLDMYIHTDIHACMHVYIIKPPIKPYKSSLFHWDYWLITDYIVSSGSTNELYICLSTHRQVMVAALSVRYAESTLLKFSQVHHWSQLAMKY